MHATSQKAKEIFVAALNLAPDQWDAHLAEACGKDGELRSRVRDLLDANAAVGSFLESPASSSVATVDEPIREGPGTIIGPYKLLEQIGEGGMGLVFMAEQQQPVRRKVALKILKPGMDTRQVIARFEAERQALALMDHPNIARVLDAGETGAGRPHFVMELVRGVAITDYCDQNRLTTRERLELFATVCQAVQHAHHKGIIHRDIKPSNVMVTLHDDVPVVKVIDFGIAKALGQQLTDKTLVTGFAQMIGTPLYMSPEQAGMSGLDIDTRSDIYSLGVLLYELLTGTTPFDKERLRAAGYDEMRRVIREEEPARPSIRLSTLGQAAVTVADRRQSDPKRLRLLLRGELDWIVMKTLEKDRNRRYETANELARDVERYLHDEPVAACPPSAWYRCRKFARRHKAGLRIAAAAALVLLLAVGGVSWALWDQAARRTELSERMAETERTVNAALIQTEQWRKQAAEAPGATSQEADAALALWGQAEGSLAQAETALRTGTADDRLRQRVLDQRQLIGQHRAQAQRTATLFRDLDDARMTRSIWIENHFDYAGAATKYAAAFAAYGLEVKPGRTEELARRIRAEQPAVREALIVALGDWQFTALRPKTAELAKLVWAIAGAADDDPWRRQFRAADAAPDATALRALSGQARQLSLPPSSLELLAGSLSFQGDRDEALALLRWARGRHLTDFWIHFELGCLLHDSEDKSPVILEEAIGCFRAALALRPVASAAHNNLGICLFDREELDEAILSYSKAIDLDPKNATAHGNLGDVLLAKKQLAEAGAEYRQAIDLDPKYAEPHNGLGALLCYGKHDYEGAIIEFRKAIDLDPKNAMAHNNLGNVLHDKQQLDKAMAEFRQAIDLDPKLALAHYGLGNILHDKHQLDEAMVEYRQAIDLDPKFAVAHNGLGDVLLAKKQLDEAGAEYRQAIHLDPKLASAHNGLGAILCDVKHDYDGAIREYEAALKINPNWAEAHCNLGLALFDKKDVEGAVREYEAALKIDPNLANAHFNLGLALHDKKDVEGAVREYEAALKINPNWVEAHYNLGLALRDKKDVEGAIREYEAALKINPNWVEAHCVLGDALRDKKDVEGAVAEYRQGIDLDPKMAKPHISLGAILCDVKHDYDGAIVEFRQAIDLDPKNAPAHHNLGVVLQARNQLDEASVEFRQAIHLDPEDAAPHYQLGIALEARNQLDEALAEYKKAIELAPKNAATWNGRGGVYSNLKQWDNAVADYAKAIELDPKYVPAWIRRGLAYSNLKQWDKALADFSKAIELDPKEAVTWNGRGGVYANLKQWDKAVADYSKAIELDPKDASAWYGRGFVYAQLKQWDKALADYSKAIELDPNNVYAWDNRRAVYLQLGQWDKALADFSKAIELDPKNANLHNNQAWLLATTPNPKGRDPRRAVDLAKKAVELAPKDGTFWNTLGVAHYRAGSWKAAIEALNQSTKMQGENAIDSFFLAMAHWQSGDKEQARKWYDRAVGWMAKNKVEDQELLGLRAEAAELLDVEAKKK